MREPLTDEEIAQECIRAIAAAKVIPAESITMNSTLESLALDSLDRVSLAFDLEEQYGIEIPEHRMHGISTVRDLVAAIRASLEAKDAAQGPGA